MNLIQKQFFDACLKGDSQQVKLLLIQDPQFDINTRNAFGFTPLTLACANSHVDVVKLLLADSRIDVNIGNNNGLTPLNFACRRGKDEIVNELLKMKQVDCNLPDKNGWTPLMVASYMSDLKIVECLLGSEHQVNISLVDKDDKTAIDVARDKSTEIMYDFEGTEVREIILHKQIKVQILNLLEKFQMDSVATKMELRIKLGFAGNFF